MKMLFAASLLAITPLLGGTTAATPGSSAASCGRSCLDRTGRDIAPDPARNLTLEIRSLSAAGAKAALAGAEAEAIRNGLRVAITVTDSQGLPLATLRMDGAPTMSIAVSAAKARTAAQLGKPSGDFQKLIDAGSVSLLSIPDFAPWEGGVPIIANETVLGAVGVSGADAAQDARTAAAGVQAISHLLRGADKEK
ncbi:MAG: hypothetical protein JWM75_1962 [Sphingomonas bacterium]|nr:hypothetical protein [Sphingomonas bacterium]